jgi:hypothetical protein
MTRNRSKHSRTTIIHASPKSAHIKIGTTVEHASGRGVVIEAYVGFSMLQMENGTSMTVANAEVVKVQAPARIEAGKPSPLRRTREGLLRIKSLAPRLTQVAHVWIASARRFSNIKRHRISVAVMPSTPVAAPLFA